MIPAPLRSAALQLPPLRRLVESRDAALRELDAAGLDQILVTPVPEEGLGRAINDRLRRASARS